MVTPSFTRKKRGMVFIVSLIILVGLLWTWGVIKRVVIDAYYRSPFAIPGIPPCPDCNVILVSLDVLRADDLPCYGYFRNTAPNLCAFAKKNSYFTQFYSVSSYTLDDHMSMFTGLYPSTHHVVAPYRDTLNPSIPTLAESMQRQGYRTLYLGLTDDPNLPLDKGVGRGFTEIHPLGRNDPSLPTQLQTILPTLRDGKPTFLFVHSYGLHSPYLPGPGPRRYASNEFPTIPVTLQEFTVNTIPFYSSVVVDFRRRLTASDTPGSITRNTAIVTALSSAIAANDLIKARAIFMGSLYWPEQLDAYNEWYWNHIDPYNDAMVAYLRGLYDERIHSLDEELGPLLNFVDRPEIKRKTIVIITSDHGEEFMEHGSFRHDNNLYNTSTYVPFIIMVPKIQHVIQNTLAQVVDIYPTILDLVGLHESARFDGRSLLPVLLGTNDTRRQQYAVSEYQGTVIQSIQDGHWKLYIHNDENGIWMELYDLVSDPGEKRNVLAAYPAIRQRLVHALENILRNSPKYDSVIGGFPDWIDKEKRQELIQTGYF